MIELIADVDDQIAEKYLEGADISEAELRAVLRRETIAMNIVPVLCGSAFKNKGVQQLLDAVVYYLPSPVDIPPVKGVLPRTGEEAIRRAADDEPFSGLIFKFSPTSILANWLFVAFTLVF